MDYNIEEFCKEYLEEIEEFRRLINLLIYDVDNLDLQIRLLLLHYKILETRAKMEERIIK